MQMAVGSAFISLRIPNSPSPHSTLASLVSVPFPRAGLNASTTVVTPPIFFLKLKDILFSFPTCNNHAWAGKVTAAVPCSVEIVCVECLAIGL